MILNLSAVVEVVKPRFIGSRVRFYGGVICRFSNLEYGGGRVDSAKITKNNDKGYKKGRKI